MSKLIATDKGFLGSCPRKLKSLPTQVCTYICPWAINSEPHSNCFWRYLQANSDREGALEEHTHATIANLLGIQVPEVQQTLNQSFDVLRKDNDVEDYSL